MVVPVAEWLLDLVLQTAPRRSSFLVDGLPLRSRKVVVPLLPEGPEEKYLDAGEGAGRYGGSVLELSRN